MDKCDQAEICTFDPSCANYRYCRERKSQTFVVPGSNVAIGELNQDTLYLSLLKKDIPQLAADYVKELEAGTTKDWCKCEWIVHPDDAEIQAMHCRDCNHPARYHLTKDIDAAFIPGPCTECECIEYKDRRVRRGEENSECAIHTKKGFILGFFLWVYRDKRN